MPEQVTELQIAIMDKKISKWTEWNGGLLKWKKKPHIFYCGLNCKQLFYDILTFLTDDTYCTHTKCSFVSILNKTLNTDS